MTVNLKDLILEENDIRTYPKYTVLAKFMSETKYITHERLNVFCGT